MYLIIERRCLIKFVIRIKKILVFLNPITVKIFMIKWNFGKYVGTFNMQILLQETLIMTLINSKAHFIRGKNKAINI